MDGQSDSGAGRVSIGYARVSTRGQDLDQQRAALGAAGCVRITGTCAAVQDSGRFNVSLLPGDGGPLALHFAGASGATGEDKFTAGDWSDDPHGIPMLAGTALTFSCTVTEAVQAGSHSIFIGQITDLSIGEGAALIYAQSAFHRLHPL